jgi:hypothetical protein
LSQVIEPLEKTDALSGLIATGSIARSAGWVFGILCVIEDAIPVPAYQIYVSRLSPPVPLAAQESEVDSTTAAG